MSDLMVRDHLTNNGNHVVGQFSGSGSMYLRMTSVSNGQSVTSCNGLNCAICARSHTSTGSIGGYSVRNLGLKCEDDGQGSWRCDDDAVYISWAMVNGSHRNG